MTGDLRLLFGLTLLIGVAMLAALVSAHEKHYAKRRLIVLEGRVRTLEAIILEDRSV